MPDSPSMKGSSHGHSFRLPRRIFVGSLISPQTLLSIKIIKNAVVGVGTSGVIRFVEDLDDFQEASLSTQHQPKHSKSHETLQEDDRSSTPVPIPNQHDDSNSSSFLSEKIDTDETRLSSLVAKHGWNLHDCELVRLSKDSFICPGFIDTHTHAPQVPNLGLGQQYELLDWLQYVTFPREKKFEDILYAQKTYESVVERMIHSGTTCAAIYATLHEEATMILADICNTKGLRALVGKCQMDRNSPVDYVEKNPSASMESTRNFINYCRALKPYGTASNLDEDVGSPLTASTDSSDSPEMNSSIARLKVTMNEMIDGTSHDETASNASSSSSSNHNHNQNHSAASSTQPRKESNSTTRSTSSSQKSDQKAQHSMHRHGSLSSSTSSLGKGRTSNGYDSPKRQKEREYSNALVQPILTPRFAISCSDALLTSISAMMSRDPSLRLQTHLSENEGEIAFTKKLFPFTSCYTEVYDHFSLLTSRTILAHAIHLNEEEMKLIVKRKCGISHCPTSNNNLRSGVSKVGEMLNRGIKVGLGTDMSGGFGMSILTAIREASVVAKVLNFKPINSSSTSNGEATEDDILEKKSPPPAVGKSPHHTGSVEVSSNPENEKRVENYDFCKGPLSVATLFYLATLGGAEVCNLAHKVGSLEVGKVCYISEQVDRIG